MTSPPSFNPVLQLAAGITLATVAAAALAASPQASEEAQPGILSEKVICRADPTHSYALLLPSQYDPQRRWPVLYVLDARGRALYASERFRAATERYGWVLVSSWDTASDGPAQPNFDAMDAMLRDTQERLSLDTHRLYLAGFSGTARVAWELAEALTGHVAAIVAASGGLPTDMDQPPASPPPAFLTAGVTDFNYQEMRRLDAALDGIEGARHRLELFDGGHDWPPAELGEKAVAWLELTAMATGRRPVVPGLVSGLYEAWLAEAEGLERRGNLYDAYLAYRSLARDVDGLLDDARAREAAERLASQPAVTETAAEIGRLASQEDDYRRRIGGVARLLLDGPLPLQVNRLAAELDLADLQRLATREATSLRGQSARRRLQMAYVQTSFYLPRDLLAHKEYSRVAASLSLALEINDSGPVIWYNLACAQAQIGQKSKALASLKRAVDLGFANLDLLKSDPDLEPLRASTEYRELVSRVPGAR